MITPEQFAWLFHQLTCCRMEPAVLDGIYQVTACDHTGEEIPVGAFSLTPGNRFHVVVDGKARLMDLPTMCYSFQKEYEKCTLKQYQCQETETSGSSRTE